MTKAKALKRFLLVNHGVDVEGNSAVSVLRNYFETTGSTVSEVLNAAVAEYTVTFAWSTNPDFPKVPSDAVLPSPVTALAGTQIELPIPTSSEDGVSFDTWWINDDGEWADSPYTVTENITLYGSWNRQVG